MGKPKKTDKQFKQEVNKLWGGEYVVCSPYQTNYKKVVVEHIKCGFYFKVKPNNFLNGTRCPKCYGNKYWDTSILKNWIRKNMGKDFILLDSYSGNKVKMKIKHTVCGHIFSRDLTHLVSSRETACPYCTDTNLSRHKRSSDKYITLFSSEGYTLVSRYSKAKAPVKLRCPKCNHTFYVRPVDFVRGSRCTFCNSSGGEQLLARYFDLRGINYIQHKVFSWLHMPGSKHPQHLDFYLPDYHLAVEYDGGQHYWPVDLYGGNKNYTDQVKKDRNKDLLCHEHGIKLIRIPYKYNSLDKISKLLDKLLLKAIR